MRYTIEVATHLAQYAQPNYLVSRRYNDFVWLHDKLVETHPSHLVPPIPGKDINPLNKFDPTFLAYRRRELERFLVRLAAHPFLHTSADLQVFLTASEDQLSRAQNPSSDSGWSMSSLWSSVSKAASNAIDAVPAFSADELDETFQHHKAYAERMELHLSRLSAAGASLVPRHHELEDALAALRAQLAAVAEVEKAPLPFERKATARCFELLGESLRMHAALERELSEKVTTGWEQALADYGRLFEEVLRMLGHRSRTLGQWQGRQKASAGRREALQSASGSKAEALRKELEQAEKQEAEAKLAFDTTNAAARNELIRFEAAKESDLKVIVRALAHAHLEYHVQAADLYKQVLSSVDQ